MIEFAESGPLIKKAARNEAAVPDEYRSSVKVVAGGGDIQPPLPPPDLPAVLFFLIGIRLEDRQPTF